MCGTALARASAHAGGPGMSGPEVVAIPTSTLRLMVAGIGLAVLIMCAMLGVEIVILLRVFDLLDLVRRLVPPA
jgi:hypothetical protein